jgi:hypothetical protein
VALVCVVPVPGFRKLKAAIHDYEAERLPQRVARVALPVDLRVLLLITV